MGSTLSRGLELAFIIIIIIKYVLLRTSMFLSSLKCCGCSKAKRLVKHRIHVVLFKIKLKYGDSICVTLSNLQKQTHIKKKCPETKYHLGRGLDLPIRVHYRYSFRTHPP